MNAYDTFTASCASLISFLKCSLLLLPLYIIYKLYIYPVYRSPIRNLHGHVHPFRLLANLVNQFRGPPIELLDEYTQKHGNILRYSGMFGKTVLYVADPNVARHVLLTNVQNYPKSELVRHELERLVGGGLLAAEGDVHKRQRRIMNLPFTQAYVNAYFGIFRSAASRLSATWQDMLHKQAEDNSDNPDKDVIEVTKWLSRATLDIIGLTAFDTDLKAMSDEDNALATAFGEVMGRKKAGGGSVLLSLALAVLRDTFPILNRVRTPLDTKSEMTMQLMQEACEEMIAQRVQAVKAGGGRVRRDLLSLLVDANLLAEKESQKLSDRELLGEMQSMIVAGHETTATALAWSLLYLVDYPHVQERLQAEIRDETSGSLDSSTLEDDADALQKLVELPYLDAFTKEILRIQSPVASLLRVAEHADVIPLKSPIQGKDGSMIDHLTIEKGQSVTVGIYSLNRSPQLWGEDAKEFRPERWLGKDDATIDGLEEASILRSITPWSSLITFAGGPRSCIGYRFAILELKTILATLICDFDFTRRSPDDVIERNLRTLVVRPKVVGQSKQGVQLPLRLRKRESASS